MSFNKFDFICETVDNGVILLDKEFNVIFWNNWLETRTKIKSSHIRGKKLYDFYPSINKNRLLRKINAALTLDSTTFYNTKLTPFLLDIKLSKVTNKVFPNMQQNVTIAPYDKEKGQVVLYIYDNTLLCETNHELKRAKDDLEDSFEEIQLLLNTTMEAIIVFDNEKCVNCNDVALELFEYTQKDQIINKTFDDFIGNSTQTAFNHHAVTPVEMVMRKKDQSLFYALIQIKQTKLRNKQLKVVTVIDISEMKAKDKLLAEQTKMAALGEMIGNIAHQWRQPLSTISTAASGVKLQKNFGILTDDMFNDAIETIMKNSKHLSQTIDDFKNFLRGDKEKVIFNLNDNINRNLKLVEGMTKNENIQLHLDYGNDVELLSYPNELTQAFLNVINNAKDAFNEKMKKNDERHIFIRTYIKNSSVFIEIKDNAHGIKDNILNKIFEPYFTTKHKSIGTGLGLYMTHQLITLSMGGSISAKNSIYTHNNATYSGAAFLIQLPV